MTTDLENTTTTQYNTIVMSSIYVVLITIYYSIQKFNNDLNDDNTDEPIIKKNPNRIEVKHSKNPIIGCVCKQIDLFDICIYYRNKSWSGFSKESIYIQRL